MLTYGYLDTAMNVACYAENCRVRYVRTRTSKGAVLAGDVIQDITHEDAVAAAEFVNLNCTSPIDRKILDFGIVEGTVEPAEYVAAWQSEPSIIPRPTPIMYASLTADERDDLDIDEATRLLTPVDALTDDETYTTPDGHPYYPPYIGKHSATVVLRRLRDAAKHAALSGPPGSGKTTLAQVAVGTTDLIVQSFNGQTTVDDVIGRWVPQAGTPGAFEWIDGPLTRAMKTGHVYLANELNRAEESVQALFLSVTDHQRRLTLDGHLGENVYAATGFMVIIDFNPGMGYDLLPALQSRMSITVNVPTPYEIAKQLGVPSEIMRVVTELDALNQQRVIDAGWDAAQWVPGIRDLIDARDNTSMFGLSFAIDALINACPDPDYRPHFAAAFSATGASATAAGLTMTARPTNGRHHRPTHY